MRDLGLIARDVADLRASKYDDYFSLFWLHTKSGLHPFWEGQFCLSQNARFHARCIYPLDYPPCSPKFRILRPPVDSFIYPNFKHLYPNRKRCPHVDTDLYLRYPQCDLLSLDDCVCTFYPADGDWVAGTTSIVTLFDFTVYFLVSWIRFLRTGQKQWPMQESPHYAHEVLSQTPFDAPCPYECGKPFGLCHAPKLIARLEGEQLQQHEWGTLGRRLRRFGAPRRR